MKNNWKTVSTALLVLAASVNLHAASPVPNTNPGEKETKTNTPAIKVAGEKVFVNHLNLEGETVTLKVYDAENRLLYVKKFNQAPVVEMAFNFESAYEGTYSIVLNDGDVIHKATVAVL